MIKSEDHIIEFIKSNIKTTSKDVLKSIGDDCAVIKVDRLRSFCCNNRHFSFRTAFYQRLFAL